MSPYPQSLAPTLGLSNTNTLTMKRKDSDELDVFEATRYFSGGMDLVGGVDPNRVFKERSIPKAAELRDEKKLVKDKCKQPSSPGSRLASFLNSFFHQTASKTKSKSKSTTNPLTSPPKPSKGGKESHGGRKRRSSISHSPNISNSDSRSFYSCGSSGFRTPPIYPNTPKEVSSLVDEAKFGDGFSERSRVLGNGYLETSGRLEKGVVFSDGFVGNRRVLNRSGDGFLKKDGLWVGDNGLSCKERSFRRSGEVEEDGESDCSSDLFELQIWDLGGDSTELPVFETTDVEVIKRGTSIAGDSFLCV